MANTRVQNATLITTNIPDNTSGAVTPEKHREVEEAINDSAVNINGDTFEAGAVFEFNNGSQLREGAKDNGLGGGIARVCTNEKYDQWEDGVRYLYEVSGSIVYAESINNVIPDDDYDESRSFAIGSRFKNLVTGIEYLCKDASDGDAVWEAQSGTYSPTFTDTNCTTTLLSPMIYTVIGDIVTMYFAIEILLDELAVDCNVKFDPIIQPTNDFSTLYEAAGPITEDTKGLLTELKVESASGTKQIRVRIIEATVPGSSHYIKGSFSFNKNN